MELLNVRRFFRGSVYKGQKLSFGLHLASANAFIGEVRNFVV